MGLTVILGVLCWCAVSMAQTEYTSYRLDTVQKQDLSGWATAEQGGLIVLEEYADTTRGSYHIQSVQNGCHWKFSWTFSQDVTQISYSRGEMAITFVIESDPGTCFTDVNPFIEFRTDGDPTMPVYGLNEEFSGRFCLHEGGNCNQNPIRKFQVYRQTSWRPNASFSINLFPSNNPHARSITYLYTGQTDTPCTAGTPYTGELAAMGEVDIQPNGTLYSSPAGTHRGTLQGPANADFGLTLLQWNGADWVVVDAVFTAGGSDPVELVYAGSEGYYQWEIKALDGSGVYEFVLQKPGEGTTCPSQEPIQFSFIGLDADVLNGPWSAGADGIMDGHFRLELNLEAPQEIQSIAVFGADANGIKNGHVWQTLTGGYWVLAVKHNGTLLTPPQKPTLGQFSGQVMLDLYAMDDGYLKSGNYLLVEVTVAGQAQPLSALIQLL
jgi:hypothetical protein